MSRSGRNRKQQQRPGTGTPPAAPESGAVSSAASSRIVEPEPCSRAAEPEQTQSSGWQRANGFRGRQLREGAAAPGEGLTTRTAPLTVSSGAGAAAPSRRDGPAVKTAARGEKGTREERMLACGEEFTVTAHNMPGISDYVDDWVNQKEPAADGFRLGSDFAVFTECHGAQAKKRGRRGWVCSEDCPDEAAPGVGGDPAAGVCIHLSDRAWAARVLGQEGSGPSRSAHRMAWVRVHAEPRDVVVVGVYAPHFKRKGPMQRQFFEDLRELLMEFPEGLQVIVCGDFNCRLGRGQHGLVGNWSIHHQFRQTEGGEQVVEMMRELGFFAASTMFQPAKRRGGAATYIPYKKTYGYDGARQLDYMLVKQQYRRTVKNVRVTWAPTELVRMGQRKDHAALRGRFCLHIETKKARKRYDESLVGKDDGVDELMDVEFRRAMCARRAARQRRAPEHQAEDAEECRAALPAEVDLDAVAPFSWLDEYGRDERLRAAAVAHLERVGVATTAAPPPRAWREADRRGCGGACGRCG